MDVAESQKITNSKICRTCKTRNNEHANFCFNCGEQHFTDVIVSDGEDNPLK
jgi:ribosomal protein L40E